MFRCKILKNKVRNVVFNLETPKDGVEKNNKRVVSDGNYTYLHDCMYSTHRDGQHNNESGVCPYGLTGHLPFIRQLLMSPSANWAKIAEVLRGREKCSELNLYRRIGKHTVHKTAICRNPPIRNFRGEKKLYRSLIDDRLVMFWRKYEDKQFCFCTQILKEGVIATQLSSGAGISVSPIVEVRLG